ncbi:putative kelch-type beta propeller, P-loop containing nucleoside triphosphate hydrolase [Helianthus debilis subsp. tardiflorus]
MATRYKEIKSWLDERNLEFLAIYGMGGSGKTTLAKHIFNINRRTFEYVSFIEDIGTRCKGPNDLLQLQEQLLRDILGGKKRKISGVSRGTCMIGDALQMNRTLIVLDDILEPTQLMALLGTGKINAESKIIITTRENTDNWFHLSCWRCQKYEMRLLNDDESLELLSRHAFGSKFPNEDYMRLLQNAARLCEGNPLALEVLGSSLLKNDTIPYWESLLNLFGRDIDSRIKGVLIRSYMSLPSDTVRELFLHIACFFIGIDMDYVAKILEPDYSATSGIKTLINRCLLSVSRNKKLMMHRLIQEMGKNIVCQESTKLPSRRSRVWLSSDSYKILSKGMGSETIEGLALDMKTLQKENFVFMSTELKTDALQNMDNLKLLQLNFVKLNGSYEKFSEDLKWLCWLGFPLSTIPSNLRMGNMVAIDMSYSNLEVFEPPMVIHSLKILNLRDSHKLLEILNIIRIPNLETLILWNCYSLVNVCKTIEGLKSLALLNMTGCKNLFRCVNLSAASTSGAVVTEQPTFSCPSSVNRLFLNDCRLECTDSFPLNFSVQPVLLYLNLGNSLFESLPCYNHLENLRVLDLSFCSRLRCLVCLPNTLAELYVYECELLERITFQSPRFTLQEFGYEGCITLYEVEGFIKLVPIAKLDEPDLGHMNWLKVYQNHEMCLAGDDELTIGRSWHIQMLYEFNIMSTSLPDIKEDPNMTPKYISKSSSLFFDVPRCPKNKRLKGINVTFKYARSGEDCVWFCKINTGNGVDVIYNPRVFGKPEFGKECIWLSYWPIGNKLNVGDTVHVSIVVFNGLEVHECGLSMVYSDVETVEDNMGWEESIGGDLSGFQLSTGSYYLCRHDFYSLMEVGRLTPDWFRILVGDTIDYTEIRGWRKTGRPNQVNPSFTELRTVRCIIHGPQLEDIYNIAEMSKSSIGDKSLVFNSRLLEEEMKTGTRSDETVEEIYNKQEIKSGLETETIGDFISTFDKITIKKSDPYSHTEKRVRVSKRSLRASKAFDSDEPPHREWLRSVAENEASGGQELTYSSSLIHALGRDNSIGCLLKCSRFDYGSIASLNREFRYLIRSGELYRLRRENGIIEHWVYFSCHFVQWEAFDPFRQRWINLPIMPSNPSFQFSDKESLAVGTELLVLGKEVVDHVIYKYSLLTNSWSFGQLMNKPRCLFGSASLGEIAIVAGGIDPNGNILNSAELYNSELGVWETIPNMLKPRKMCSGVFMDNKFYVIGGIDETDMELTCGEEYDLGTRVWREIPNMTPVRAGGAASAARAPPLVAVVDNELYAADYGDMEVRKHDKARKEWETVGRLPERVDSMNGWGIAFKGCGDRIIILGGPRTSGAGFIEVNSWVPRDGPPRWTMLGRKQTSKQTSNFVYNCAVMGC